jgi:hypothetical protein
MDEYGAHPVPSPDGFGQQLRQRAIKAKLKIAQMRLGCQSTGLPRCIRTTSRSTEKPRARKVSAPAVLAVDWMIVISDPSACAISWSRRVPLVRADASSARACLSVSRAEG